ncbi:hypothetical protein NQZ68_022137 [Dissostichus eleginoides]|nr:hypothetical protein NQZ68_022137 [Dissostichus eleginoides]
MCIGGNTESKLRVMLGVWGPAMVVGRNIDEVLSSVCHGPLEPRILSGTPALVASRRNLRVPWLSHSQSQRLVQAEHYMTHHKPLTEGSFSTSPFAPSESIE